VNALAKSLDDLREKRILRFDADAARRVSLHWPGGKVVLARGDPGWKLEEPIVGPADQTTVDELLSDLSFLRASGFVDAPTPQQEGLLAAPELEVEIEIRPEQEGGEARQLKLAIGGRESAEGERLARAEGTPALFRLPSERLLDFPREVGSYRFRELARFDLDQAERLEIAFQPPGQAAVTVTAIRGEQGWSSTPDAVEPAKLATMIDELSRLRANKILADSMGEAELRELGLAPPNARLTVSGEPGQLAQVDLGVSKGADGLVARSSSGSTVYLLASHLGDVFPVSLEALRSGFLDQPGPTPGGESPAESTVSPSEPE
jgi:hypothetical protein